MSTNFFCVLATIFLVAVGFFIFTPLPLGALLVIIIPIALFFWYILSRANAAKSKMDMLINRSEYTPERFFRCSYDNFLAIDNAKKVVLIGTSKHMDAVPYSNIISWREEWEKNSRGDYTKIILFIKVRDLNTPLYKLYFARKANSEECSAALEAVLG